MNKHPKKMFFMALVLVIVLVTISPAFTNWAEVEGLGLKPWSYLPVIERPLPTPTFTPEPTDIPMPTPTATSPPSNVLLNIIVYDPPGDDVAGEYVQITNFGGTAETMTGWTLRDTAPTIFTFPTFTLNSYSSVKIWTKAGTNDAGNLYWSQDQPVWNNDGGDVAFLRDSNGHQVDSCSYAGGGQFGYC
ncbi:MAG: lamin tail domain-containing protein [Candidatus Promineifilaceae bacterium]